MGAVAATAAVATVSTSALASCAEAAGINVHNLKVLLINGSARRKGNTFTLLNEISEQLKKHSIESEIFGIGNRPIRGCVACGQCHAKNLGKCVFDDDVCNQLIEKMGECDAVVVGSPVYYGQPAGQVLSVIQRMAYAGGAKMQGKPAAAVTVCRRGGATAAFQTLQMPFQMLNMPIVTSQYWNIGYGSAEGEVSKDDEGLQTMRTLADNMAYMLKQFATGTAKFPEREQWKMTNFIR
ncbi:MAG: flavodoxin family protein [Bacteroidales bacterium]|nr:flavodoxin family protein [Bacteroidales bacterium]